MDQKHRRHKIRRRVNDGILTAATYIIAIAFVFPVFWVLLMSLKKSVDAFAIPPKWIFSPVLENFVKVFSNNYFVHNYKNSFLLAFVSTALSLAIGMTAAYALTRFRFRGRRALSFWILVTRM